MKVEEYWHGPIKNYRYDRDVSTYKTEFHLKVWSLALTNLLGTAGRYRIQEGMVDSYGITLGFMEVDAQAVISLSTSEGQKETRKRPTRERQQS